MYIGSGSIGTRLRAHAGLRTDFKDKGWLLSWIGFEKRLQVCFFECAEPGLLEGDLLVEYLSAHQELPPANWRRPTLSERQKQTLGAQIALTYLNSLAPNQRNQRIKEVQDRIQPQKG